VFPRFARDSDARVYITASSAIPSKLLFLFLRRVAFSLTQEAKSPTANRARVSASDVDY